MTAGWPAGTQHVAHGKLPDVLWKGSSQHARLVHELYPGETAWDAQRVAISIGTAVELLLKHALALLSFHLLPDKYAVETALTLDDKGILRDHLPQLTTVAGLVAFDRANAEIGWGSGVKHPRPPRPPVSTQVGSTSMPSTSIAGDTQIVLDRLDTVLQRATGLSPKASAVEGTLVPRGDALLPGATIKFAAKDVRGADRAALFADGQFVHLGVWPAELQPQYSYLYSNRVRVDALLELDTHTGFTVEPNFQLAHRFAQPLQRWFPTRLLSAEDYLGQWIDDFHAGRAGGRTRDEIADPGFFSWLVARRYALASEEESLHQWLDSKKAGIQIHIRPGVQIRRTWSYAEALAIESQNDFAMQVRKATDHILTALGQTNLSFVC
jgi:hypothetical protein